MFGADEKVARFDCVMPAGAMLGTTEKVKQQAGGKGYTAAQLEQSNLYFARMLGTIEPRYLPRGKCRNGPSLTAEQSSHILAEAYRNTPVLPPVTRYNPGLPCGAPRIADSFLGMQKAPTGASGMIAWQDLASSIAGRERWDEAMAEMSERDVQTLDRALEARNLAELSPGGTERGARKRGKARLIEAAKKLDEALKSAA